MPPRSQRANRKAAPVICTSSLSGREGDQTPARSLVSALLHQALEKLFVLRDLWGGGQHRPAPASDPQLGADTGFQPGHSDGFKHTLSLFPKSFEGLYERRWSFKSGEQTGTGWNSL